MTRVRVRLSCCGGGGVTPPPLSLTSLFARIEFVMAPGSLWTFFFGAPLNGGTGLTLPVLNGGGIVGLNIAAFGSRGFLPLVAFDASVSPSSKGAGLQLVQCCNSILGWPSAFDPTWILMQVLMRRFRTSTWTMCRTRLFTCLTAKFSSLIWKANYSVGILSAPCCINRSLIFLTTSNRDKKILFVD